MSLSKHIPSQVNIVYLSNQTNTQYGPIKIAVLRLTLNLPSHATDTKVDAQVK